MRWGERRGKERKKNRENEEKENVTMEKKQDFFFFKQKTAYEIKECDWSSDVCSSDLVGLKLKAEKQK